MFSISSILALAATVKPWVWESKLKRWGLQNN